MLNISRTSQICSPTKLSKMTTHDELGTSLHAAAVHGDKKKLKRILKTGVAVDYPNTTGQTALFCACFEGHESIVEILLLHNANPNQRTHEGTTPTHVAAYSGNTQILQQLIDAGADLRLHDAKSRTVKDWAKFHSDPRRRHKMVEFIEKTRHLALADTLGRMTTENLRDENSSQFVIQPRPENLQRKQHLRTENHSRSLSTLLGLKYPARHICSSPSIQNHGFGKLYFGSGEHVGTMATVPLVRGTSLKHDSYGCTYNNGPFMVMESMFWNKTMVTVKRLHKEPVDGGQVDLLIHENDYMARLRHPNILLLMGVCQTNNLDDLILIYERVGCGSLFSHIYQRVETLDTLALCEVLRQIGDALDFLHQHNLVHCYVTSHAVQLVLPNYAKLSNFEYMMEMSGNHDSGMSCGVLENKYINAAYNWIAPEVLAGEPPNEKSDLYSLCAVLWELLTGSVPWSGYRASEIKTEVVENRNMLEISTAIKKPFQLLLQYGLTVEPKGRHLTIEQFRDILAQVIVDYSSMDIKGDSPHPSRNAAVSKAGVVQQRTRCVERYPSSVYRTPIQDVVDGDASDDEEEGCSPTVLARPEVSLASDQYSNEQSDAGEGSETMVKTREDLLITDEAKSSDVNLKQTGEMKLCENSSAALDEMREEQFTAGLRTDDNAVSTPQTAAPLCRSDKQEERKDKPLSNESGVDSRMEKVEAQLTAVYQQIEQMSRQTTTRTTTEVQEKADNQPHNVSTTSKDSQFEFIMNPAKRAFFERTPSPCKSSEASTQTPSDTDVLRSWKNVVEEMKDRACGTEDLAVDSHDTVDITAEHQREHLLPAASAAQSDTVPPSSPHNPFQSDLQKQETGQLPSQPIRFTSAYTMSSLNSKSSLARSVSSQNKGTVYGTLSRNFPPFDDALQTHPSGRNVARIGASFKDLKPCLPAADAKNNLVYSANNWSSPSVQSNNKKTGSSVYKPASHLVGDPSSPHSQSSASSVPKNYALPTVYLRSQKQEQRSWTKQDLLKMDSIDGRFSSPCAVTSHPARVVTTKYSKRSEAKSSTQGSPTRLSPREEKNAWCQGKGIKALITGFQGQLEEHVKKQAVLVKKRKQSSDSSHTHTDNDISREWKCKSGAPVAASSLSSEADTSIEAKGSSLLYQERALELLARAKPSSASPSSSSNNVSKTRSQTSELSQSSVDASTSASTEKTDEEAFRLLTSSLSAAFEQVMDRYVSPRCASRHTSLHRLHSAISSTATDMTCKERSSQEQLIDTDTKSATDDQRSAGGVASSACTASSGHDDRLTDQVSDVHTGSRHSQSEDDLMKRSLASAAHRNKQAQRPFFTHDNQSVPPRASYSSSSTDSDTRHVQHHMMRSLHHAAHHSHDMTPGDGLDMSDASSRTPHSPHTVSAASSATITSLHSPGLLTEHTLTTVDEAGHATCEKVKLPDMVDYYFDDELSPGMLKNKHMRLQTTLALDTPCDSPTLVPDSEEPSYQSSSTSCHVTCSNSREREPLLSGTDSDMTAATLSEESGGLEVHEEMITATVGKHERGVFTEKAAHVTTRHDAPCEEDAAVDV